MFKFIQAQSPMTIALKTLNFMLSLKRPHGGDGVAKVVKYLFKHHPQATIDACGNVHIDARLDLRHTSLFVAHMDTVHRKEGVNRFIRASDKLTAHLAPLGADDGAGIAILMAMLHAKVPGYYVFTQGEEVGGIGAKYLRRHSPTLLAQFDRAIAFDRRSTTSVITHQGLGRCCSDDFANRLSDQLNALGMMMMPDDSGVYTDTAEWVDVISECTNISCGYFLEHTKQEWLDLSHFKDLVKAVVCLDWDSLPVARDPKAIDPQAAWWWQGNPELDMGEAFDSECYRVMLAIEAAEEGDDFELKQLMADAVALEQRSLVLNALRTTKVNNKVLDYGFNWLGYLDNESLLLDMLELTDASLV